MVIKIIKGSPFTYTPGLVAIVDAKLYNKNITYIFTTIVYEVIYSRHCHF